MMMVVKTAKVNIRDCDFTQDETGSFLSGTPLSPGLSGLAFGPANGTSRETLFPFPFFPFPSLMQVLLHVACPINAFNPAVREQTVRTRCGTDDEETGKSRLRLKSQSLELGENPWLRASHPVAIMRG